MAIQGCPLHVERVCGEVAAWLTRRGWRVAGVSQSPIIGPEGNVEFLIGAEKVEPAETV